MIASKARVKVVQNPKPCGFYLFFFFLRCFLKVNMLLLVAVKLFFLFSFFIPNTTQHNTIKPTAVSAIFTFHFTFSEKLCSRSRKLPCACGDGSLFLHYDVPSEWSIFGLMRWDEAITLPFALLKEAMHICLVWYKIINGWHFGIELIWHSSLNHGINEGNLPLLMPISTPLKPCYKLVKNWISIDNWNPFCICYRSKQILSKSWILLDNHNISLNCPLLNKNWTL